MLRRACNIGVHVRYYRISAPMLARAGYSTVTRMV